MESGGHAPLQVSTPADAATDTAVQSNGVHVNGNSNGNAAPAPQTKICVYCGSSPGNNPAHMEAARQLARHMHENGIALGESNLQPSRHGSH